MRLIQLLTLAGLMLMHGTVLVGLTWLASATVLRRCRPALIAAVWTVVLIKFLVPPLFPASFGYSSMLSLIASKAEQVAVLAPRDSQGMMNPASLGNGFQADTSGSNKERLFYRQPLLAAGLGLYLCLLIGLIARSIFYFIHLRRRLRSLPKGDETLQQEVATLAARLRLRHPPRLRIDRTAITPFVTGLWKPILVMPETLPSVIPSEVREALLIHELAHIKRGDILVRWVQNLARLLFFFWPPIWWVCRRLERYAEIACDEWAIRFSSVNPEAYAETLLVIARGVRVRPWRGCEVGLSSTVGTMTARFERILGTGNERSPRMSWLILAFILCWGVFVLSGSALVRHSEVSSTPTSTAVIATHNSAVTSLRSSRTESQQEAPQVRAKKEMEMRRLEEQILIQRRREKPTQELSMSSDGKPFDSSSIDQNKTQMIDLNGDGAISDFEAGYSAAQTFIRSRNRGGGDDERRQEIERREQERQALRNRPPNNR
jgi:beta-lactamase regulating signal transducer with metallopeptidase domain